jgi:hypothetical protein
MMPPSCLFAQIYYKAKICQYGIGFWVQGSGLLVSGHWWLVTGRWTPAEKDLELDVEERKLARQLLRRRENILKAVYLFTEGFLRTPLNSGSIQPILEKLGHAAEISRVYIFRNNTTRK